MKAEEEEVAEVVEEEGLVCLCIQVRKVTGQLQVDLK